MKYLDLFSHFALNEYMDNRKESRYILRSLLDKFRSLPAELGIQVYDSMGQRIHIKATEFSPVYKKILDSKAIELKRQGILLTYSIEETDNPRDLKFYDIKIYFKQELTKRVIPTQKLYHLSAPENRQEIILNGLKPMTNDEWGHTLKYKPAVFATLADKQLFYPTYKQHEYDTWEIDTTNLTNKWWHDLNTFYGDIKASQHIMTYDAIPAEALTLIKRVEDYYENSYQDEDDEY